MDRAGETKQYRSEWKYCAGDVVLQQIRERLAGVMDTDSHAGPLGKYMIHSLYFDDLNDSCARTNVSGESRRFKFRIRYYGEDTKSIHLEKKEKENSYCHKKSCPLTKEEYDLLTGEGPGPSSSAGELLFSEKPLIREFSRAIISHGFSPKVIVDYEREAFVEPVSNVRITFDRAISACGETDEFLTGDYTPVPILPGGMNVLEVKFDDVLPSYIKKAIESTQLTQQAFSKYYLSRIAVQDFYKFS